MRVYHPSTRRDTRRWFNRFNYAKSPFRSEKNIPCVKGIPSWRARTKPPRRARPTRNSPLVRTHRTPTEVSCVSSALAYSPFRANRFSGSSPERFKRRTRARISVTKTHMYCERMWERENNSSLTSFSLSSRLRKLEDSLRAEDMRIYAEIIMTSLFSWPPTRYKVAICNYIFLLDNLARKYNIFLFSFFISRDGNWRGQWTITITAWSRSYLIFASEHTS